MHLMNYQLDKLLVPDQWISYFAVLAAMALAIGLSIRPCRTIRWLDRDQTNQLRGTAILFVVFGHLWTHVVSEASVPKFAGEAVSLFLMLSGFGLTMSLGTDVLKLRSFCSKRVSRILLPYWIVTLVFVLLDRFLLSQTYSFAEIVSTLAGYNGTRRLKSIDYARWYVSLQLIWYVGFFLANRFLPRTKALLALACTAVVLVVLRRKGLLPFGGQSQLLAFPLGCLLAYHRDRVWGVISRKGALTCLIPLLLLLLVLTRGIPDWIGETPHASLKLLKVGAMCIDGIAFAGLLIAVAGAFARLGVASRFLALVGVVSYELFLIHGPLLIKYNPIFGAFPADLLALGFCIWLAGVIVLSWLIHLALQLLSRRCLDRISAKSLTYLALVHFFLWMVLLRSDFVGVAMWRLGGRDMSPSSERTYRTTRLFHDRVDGCVPIGSVLFFGDSHVQGLCVSAVAKRAVNFGVGKDSTAGLRERIARYSSTSRARAIVLAIGINDIRSGRDSDVCKNVRAIVMNLPKHVPVVISAVLPIDERVKGVCLNERVIAVNRSLRLFCDSSERCSFVDSGSALTDESGNLRKDCHGGDGLHLSTYAYRIWISDIRRALRSLSIGS